MIDKFHLPSFLAGAPCLSAGSMAASGSRIREVNDHSGHYPPTAKETWAFMTEEGLGRASAWLARAASARPVKGALGDGGS